MIGFEDVDTSTKLAKSDNEVAFVIGRLLHQQFAVGGEEPHRLTRSKASQTDTITRKLNATRSRFHFLNSVRQCQIDLGHLVSLELHRCLVGGQRHRSITMNDARLVAQQECHPLARRCLHHHTILSSLRYGR